MSTIYHQIAEAFIARLREVQSVDADKVEQLRVLLGSREKIKSDEFVKIFSTPAGGDLK
jgi:hypothetical protein